ncbi:MAG: monofunctional biosynthetic peptidoglycan transglycosylase [Bacteroidetes bacterium]|nr:monofunctional biosynthetic peptidoglycan transglycosylase [Bacteroidota bacterium]
MKEFLKKFWRFILKTITWFFAISILSVIFFRWVPIPITPLMVIRCIEQKMDGKSMQLKKDWVPLEQISPNLQLAVVCSEDQNFIGHYGFDLIAIDKAMDYNATHKKQRGASTISQQTAKNVFLGTRRNWFRKGFEVYFTFLIETIWSKERIMEVYLNVIEMGDGVYGAQAASTAFFHKNAMYLTKGESSLVAAVLPNPRKFSATNPSPYVRKRQAWIIHQMALSGELNYSEEKEKPKRRNR